MSRVEIIGDATLHLGDCRDVELPASAALVSDPPYGMGWDTRTARFSGGQEHHRRRRDGFGGRSDWSAIVEDNTPFEPARWLGYDEVILWGANHYAARLPVGTTLVWVKRLDDALGSFLSDAEVGWEKGGHGVYCFRDLTNYALTKDRAHPTQKPVGLMEWCIKRTRAETIADPYMGSGSTGVACVKLGRKFVGVEIEQRYFDAACRRIEEAWKQPRLFSEPPPSAEQLALEIE